VQCTLTVGLFVFFALFALTELYCHMVVHCIQPRAEISLSCFTANTTAATVTLFYRLVFVNQNQATGYAIQHIWCLSQARIKCQGCGRKGIWRKMGDDGGGSLINPDGVASSRMVGVSASDIFPCSIKSRRSLLLAPAHPGSPEKGP